MSQGVFTGQDVGEFETRTGFRTGSVVGLGLGGKLLNAFISYLSMMTGSDGVSFLFPQLFLSQQRLTQNRRISQKLQVRQENSFSSSAPRSTVDHVLHYGGLGGLVEALLPPT